MRLQIISDLHLEFQKTLPKVNNAEADILILAGDISNANHLYRNPPDHNPVIIQKDAHIHHARRYREFFKHVSEQWPIVIYTMGNHEFYDGVWERTETVIREEMSRYPNIHVLEQNKLVINDIVFLGATLWTDMNREDPITMMMIHNEINDYKAIAHYDTHYGWRRLMPQTTVNKYNESIRWFKLMLSEDNRKTVVVSHHAPSRQSVHENYRGQWMTNGAFVNNLDELIIDHPHIALWTAGHVHHAHRYYIGNTLIAINPAGYPGEQTGFDPNRIIDLDNMPSIESLIDSQLW
jgi:Icc-related predicted phosphoesterase